MNRGLFASVQAREVDRALSIDPDGKVDRASFERLAMESHDCLTGLGFSVGPFAVFEDAFDHCVRVADERPGSVPPELVQRWKDWAIDYPAFAAQHPRLEMLSIMSALSERIFGASWMTAGEDVLQDWADQDGPLPPPNFVAPGGWIEPAIHRRLKDLRRRAGGWLFMNDDGEVVFAPEPEWQRIRALRKAAAAERAGRRRG